MWYACYDFFLEKIVCNFIDKNKITIHQIELNWFIIFITFILLILG